MLSKDSTILSQYSSTPQMNAILWNKQYIFCLSYKDRFDSAAVNILCGKRQ